MAHSSTHFIHPAHTLRGQIFTHTSTTTWASSHTHSHAHHSSHISTIPPQLTHSHTLPQQFWQPHPQVVTSFSPAHHGIISQLGGLGTIFHSPGFTTFCSHRFQATSFTGRLWGPNQGPFNWFKPPPPFPTGGKATQNPGIGGKAIHWGRQGQNPKNFRAILGGLFHSIPKGFPPRGFFQISQRAPKEFPPGHQIHFPKGKGFN